MRRLTQFCLTGRHVMGPATRLLENEPDATARPPFQNVASVNKGTDHLDS